MSFLAFFFIPSPSRSVTKLFLSAHHLMSCESQRKFRHSRTYYSFQPLLLSIVRGPFPVPPHHLQRLTQLQIRLLPCTFSHVVTAVSASPLWHARFSNRRSHPVTDAWSRNLRGFSCPSPVPPVYTVVKLSLVPVQSIRTFRPVVEFFPSWRIVSHFVRSCQFITFL